MANPRRSNGTAAVKLRRRVLREEDTCHLCDQAVDKTLPPQLPGSPEVDHVVPVTYGGAVYDRANARLSHRWCNRRRWHRPVHIGRTDIHTNMPTFTTDGQIATATTTATAKVSRNWLAPE